MLTVSPFHRFTFSPFHRDSGLVAYVYSLAENTTSTYLAFATSAFSRHSLLGAISTATSVLGGVSKPFIAKLSDITSRPWAYAVSLVFYVVGIAVIAGSHSVSYVAAGELLLTVGATGLDLVTDIIVADITPLQWRGFGESRRRRTGGSRADDLTYFCSHRSPERSLHHQRVRLGIYHRVCWRGRMANGVLDLCVSSPRVRRRS